MRVLSALDDRKTQRSGHGILFVCFPGEVATRTVLVVALLGPH